MSADLPDSVDAWRAVAGRRVFEGKLPLAAFKRLCESLADADGACVCRLSFDRDVFGVATVELEADAVLPLICQRSLERFMLPVSIRQRLGLVRDENEEMSLPGEVEPVLVGADGELKPLELVEDELILALPVVPMGPDGLVAELSNPAASDEPDEPKQNPFAALAALKAKKE
ncbi:YceD family protein [Pseudomarimonas arenosa]|uniref:Large ribosomal RNA subunit accumulation protein YceD n=1 Tax=Pseudomarimonas arenosa TaxID=2774145 RepID=A0AAW3ZJA6_9GAMM|nr:YceD family protein [Pseudomarimonas arenosa]MBD8526173.1 DUF177 domain-containing protein [Pseudomarimonas arenosa]